MCFSSPVSFEHRNSSGWVVSSLMMVLIPKPSSCEVNRKVVIKRYMERRKKGRQFSALVVCIPTNLSGKLVSILLNTIPLTVLCILFLYMVNGFAGGSVSYGTLWKNPTELKGFWEMSILRLVCNYRRLHKQEMPTLDLGFPTQQVHVYYQDLVEAIGANNLTYSLRSNELKTA